ncbi:hypothetical protein J4413_04200 [Candidatus Woesearchaeota archaeon]|nr:hypothetical protein [Candidatus Woesearchaeota archaeon]
MRFGTLAKGSLAALLTLTGCGKDDGVSSKQGTPFQYAETREGLTEFVRIHYNSRERFPDVDSVVVNNGDVTIYGGFLDSRNEKIDTTEVRTDSTLTTTRTRETPRVDHIVVDVEPFNDYRTPSLRLEENPRFELGGRIPADGLFLGVMLNAFYNLYSERNDCPDCSYSWYAWDWSASQDVWTEVKRRLVK